MGVGNKAEHEQMLSCNLRQVWSEHPMGSTGQGMSAYVRALASRFCDKCPKPEACLTRLMRSSPDRMVVAEMRDPVETYADDRGIRMTTLLRTSTRHFAEQKMGVSGRANIRFVQRS